MSDSLPIFIGGMFKSGTSLLRAMLGQHPRIAAGLETYWFNLDWAGARDAAFAAHIDRLRAFFGLDAAEMERIVAGSASVHDFLDRLMGAYARAQGKTRWCEKTPGNIHHLDRIVEGWPGARIVHVVREPLDVLASIKEAGRQDWVEAFPDMWCRFVGGGAEQAARLGLGARQLLELRYETLVLHPEDAMRQVLDFVGEGWDGAAASFEGRKHDYDVVLSVTGKASTTLKRLSGPLSRERLGIWPDRVTPKEAEAVRREIGARGFGDLFDAIRAGTASVTR